MTMKPRYTAEAALDRLIEKLHARLERAETALREDSVIASFDRGAISATKLAIEDAELLRSLTVGS